MRVQPPFLSRELNDMFMVKLQGPYLGRMVGSTSPGFSDLVLASERIDNMIKIGKIQNTASTPEVVKKPYVKYGKKQEGEANETVVVKGRAPTYHALYQKVTTVAPTTICHPS